MRTPFVSPPSTNKPGRPRDESLPARRREEILDSATRLFARRGYPDTDLDSIAAELGVAKGTLYNYFPSKRDLFLAAVDRGVADLHRTIHAGIDPKGDGLDCIEKAIAIFIDYFQEHSELVELFIQERAYFRERAKPAYFAHFDADTENRMAFLQALIDAGRIRAIPGMPDLDPINDLLYGTVLANHFNGRRVASGEQAKTIVDIVFFGILTDGERRRRRERGKRS